MARLLDKGRHHTTPGPVVTEDRTGLVTFQPALILCYHIVVDFL